MPCRDSICSSQDPEASSITQSALLSPPPLELEDQLSLADPPEVTLKKAFSLDGTASRSARRRQEAPAGKTLPPFTVVGQGSFGVVYAQTGTPYVLKGEINPCVGENLLWKELISHITIIHALESMKMLGVSVHVPHVIDYIAEDQPEWWEEHMERFGDDNKSLPERRRHLIQAERIFPVPERVRESLIQMYCPEAAKKAARASRANRDCLVRIYLGKDAQERPSRFFTLRNFRLHRNQMEQLGLDLRPFAEAMGQALAVIHWIALTDARDIEFVLGSPPSGVHSRVRVPCLKELQQMPPDSQLHPQAKGFNFRQRVVHIWCLDFNQARPITLDSAGVQMCVDAFLANDPYYPRPGSNEWATFSETYLTTTDKALQKCETLQSMSTDDIEKIRSQNLARCFLTGVWERQQLQKQGGTN